MRCLIDLLSLLFILSRLLYLTNAVSKTSGKGLIDLNATPPNSPENAANDTEPQNSLQLSPHAGGNHQSVPQLVPEQHELPKARSKERCTFRNVPFKRVELGNGNFKYHFPLGTSLDEKKRVYNKVRFDKNVVQSTKLSELYLDIDLNKSPPTSPEPLREQDHAIDQTSHVEIAEHLPTVLESSRQKKGERSTPLEEGEERVAKQKRKLHVYPPGLTTKEKARFRNKANYHSEQHLDLKRRKREYNRARYQRLKSNDKEQLAMKRRKEYDAMSFERKEAFKAKKRTKYSQLSSEEKKEVIRKARLHTVQRMEALQPKEREKARLEKNLKERERKRTKKTHTKKRSGGS
ncbi:uncharacterized protein FA14DRAFT_156247 [Meira miltonrushii]|uniref:Uncharacterized protein n=1 Tax=Meira miltonrushii TaxID=1280837 RepID=A0A316V7R1_9BASI|nr:uncharacterized protein FA14DRAFT_156247 [Meira miltonrushii]PWN33556.1 hypothetical protein FA14DRAFT_156247 [Meira miltonrushii]